MSVMLQSGRCGIFPVWRDTLRPQGVGAPVWTGLLFVAFAACACGSGTTPAGPTPPLAPTTASTSASRALTACGQYFGSGQFVVAADLPTDLGPPCLSFADGSGQLDCQGHEAGSISISNTQDFAIRNCVLHGTVRKPGLALQNLTITSSSGLMVDSVHALGQVLVNGCQHCTFSHDTFVYPMEGYEVTDGFIHCELCLNNGAGNQVLDSTIDGGWNGDPSGWRTQGCDDGIAIYEADGVFIGNTIRNAWDAGLEGTDVSVPTVVTIDGNTIIRAGQAAIGGYVIPGWQNSAFTNNTVSDSGALLVFVAPALGDAAVAATIFANNQIVGNRFVNPIPLDGHPPGAPSSTINFVMSGRPYTVSGNLVQNNDFGTATAAPVLRPGDGFVDGGGNICQPGGVLACLGSPLADLFEFSALAPSLDRGSARRLH